MIPQTKDPRYKRCNQCGHYWMPRNTDNDPIACPKCKRYDWKEEKKQ